MAFGLVVAGIAAAALVGTIAEYRRDHWLPAERWVGLGLFTLFGFGVVAKDFRSQWLSRRFLLYFGSLLTAHCVAYTVLLLNVTEWKLIWFLPLSLAEFAFIAHMMDVKMGRYDALR